MFITTFVLIGLVGLVTLLVLGGGGGPTEQVSTPQTLPVGGDDPATSSPADGGPVTTPDGAPAPEGVQEVRVSDGVTTFVFEVPEDASTGELAAEVAPTGAELVEDGSAIVLTIGCAGSSEEFLAQVSVGESVDTITVASVALVPASASPCEDGASTRSIQVPLVEPAGDRSVVVVPPGTEIPELETA